MYAVIVSMPGYLPESDPIYCASKREAAAAAYNEVSRFREDGCRARGNGRDGYRVWDPRASSYHLGWIVEIVAVDGWEA